MKKIKLFPAVMTVLSALYFVSVLVSEDFKYDVDTVGGDPGGKLLPLIMAGFLFLGFLYITIKERPDGTKLDKETGFLFILTLCLSMSYVLLLKTVGFVIMSTILLYTLLYFYTNIGLKKSAKEAVVGGLGTLVLTLVFYYASRFISKNVIKMGRSGALPAFFGKSTGAAVIALFFVVAVIVLLSFTLVKFLKKKGHAKVAAAGIITFSTVLFLYVVFKQFFMVSLATGFIKY